ncbi:MAG: PAS domain S-box protein [Syntrophobacteraceae bacterium]
MKINKITHGSTRGQICLAVLMATTLGSMVPFVGLRFNFLHIPGSRANLDTVILAALVSALVSAVFLLPSLLSLQKVKKNIARKQFYLFEKITDSIPYPIFYKDTKGVYIGCNSAFEKCTGKPREAIIGKTVFDIAPLENAKFYHEVDLEVLEKSGIKHFDGSFLYPDGTLHDILFTKATFCDSTGKTAGIVGTMLDITERKKTERILEKSETRLRQIIDLVPHMIFVRDAEGKYLLANRAVAAKYNTSVEAILGKKFFDLHPQEEERDRMLKDDLEVIRSGKTIFVPEEPWSDSEGNLHYLQTFKAPFHTNGENIRSVLGVAIDITEHKRIEKALRQSEEKLRESEKRYRSVVENMQDVFYRTDLDGVITLVNPSVLKLYGATPEELLGRNIKDFWLYPQEREKMLEQIQRDGVVRDYEVTVRNKQGALLVVAVTSSFRKDREGNVLGIDGVLRDITERKRVEEEHALLAKAIEEVAEAIIVTDVNWHIQYANPAFEQITGYRGEEIIGMHTRVLKSDRHDKNFYRTVRETLKRGDTWSGRVTNKRKNGTEYTAEATGAAIRDDSGAIRNFISIHRDVTRELQLENQLRQSQKMEALGTLAGGIAHDFNNILGIIMGYTQLAMYDLDSGKPVRYKLDEVLKATCRAKELVKQILAFSRRSEQQKIPLQLETIVKEAMRILRPSLPSTIEIRTDLTSREAILADPSQMDQVLMNLCTNAAHAMQDKGGVLEVALADIELASEASASGKDLRPGQYVALTVTDSGHGIDPSIIDSIFDPFFTTKEQGKGTGLGLAVVHGVVESHGGAISVESLPGKGSSFKVLFPAMKGEPAPVEKAEPFSLAFGTERILVVDDEPVLAEMLQQMLTELGYDAVFRTSGLEALETFRHQPQDKAFDLVITDITMPHFTGVDLARELITMRREVPVIVMTGYSEKIDQEKAEAMGISGFILKPVSLKKLAVTLRTVLDGKKAL